MYNNRKKKLGVYLTIFSLLFLALLGLGILNSMSIGSFLILGALVILIISLLSFWGVRGIVIFFIVTLPTIISLAQYQISIAPFLNFVGIEKTYEVDAFLLARIFIFVLAFVEILRRGRNIFKVPLFFILSIFLAFNAISFFSSNYKAEGLAFFWFHFVAALGTYFLGYFLFNSKKKYFWILMSIVFSSIIPMIIGIKQLFLKEFFFEQNSALPRLPSNFGHPNNFGMFLFLVITIYLIIYLAIQIKKNVVRNKVLLALPFLILLPLLVLTFSRTAWIALAFAIILIAITYRPLRIPAFVLGSLSAFLLLIIEKTRARILDIFSPQVYNSLAGRMEIWNMGLFELKKNPLLGSGPGSFSEVIKNVRGSELGITYPHSDTVRFLVEGGILGFIGYPLYLIGAIYYALRSYLKFSKGDQWIKFLGKRVEVNMKLLGFVPLVLFLSMALISLTEAPSLAFFYQVFAWITLGSWLGLSSNKKETAS